jgi:hypothetical protein
MIGVSADPAEYPVVSEFFQLFKTPWEFYRSDRRYDVVLWAGGDRFEGDAKLVLCYGAVITDLDRERGNQVRQGDLTCFVSYQGCRIPIYGNTVTFPEKRGCLVTDEVSRQCVAYLDRGADRVLARIGYDLFREIRTLLEAGQPPANAHIPALELHIAFLRDLITGCGVPLVEIPPVPEGYRFIACLTHDIDHPSIRRHGWDHTTFGFLYRATFGCFRDFLRGRVSVRGLLHNWMATLKLPLVHLGLAKDFWRDFDDSYLKLEAGKPSTFFVIPFENSSGKKVDGPAPKFRAARYGARDIAGTIQTLMAASCEVGLHGIDAWIDNSRGSEELAEIRRLTGTSDVGVRMHWLYYDQHSPSILEAAGAVYDSTSGYNETVGYLAGTTQAFQPAKAQRMLELPLHVMDTALFYPAYLGLSQPQARTLIGGMIDHVVRFGGCLTINWHDRSTAPERCWSECYRHLLQDLKDRGAWFATAGQAVSWFRKRRSAVFAAAGSEGDLAHTLPADDRGADLPGLRLRVYKPQAAGDSETYSDTVISSKEVSLRSLC